MILPYAVDAEVLPCVALTLETGFFQQPYRCHVGGDASRLEPVQVQARKAERDQDAQRHRHQALARVGFAHPIADAAGLRDAAAYVRQRYAANQHVVSIAENEERVGLVGALVLGVALEAAAERPACEIIGRPDRLPRFKKGAALLA